MNDSFMCVDSILQLINMSIHSPTVTNNMRTREDVSCPWSVVLCGTLLKLRLNILKIIYAVHLKNANLRRYSIGLPNFYCTKDKRTFSYFVTDSYYSFDICKLILQDFCLVLIIVLRCVLFHYLHVYVNQVITGHVCVRIMVQALFTSSPGQA